MMAQMGRPSALDLHQRAYDSFESSASESDLSDAEGGDAREAKATERNFEEVWAASKPDLSYSGTTDGFQLHGHRNLRGQETAHSLVKGAGLPRPAHYPLHPGMYESGDQPLGLLGPDPREVVGIAYDGAGKPVAEILADPLPPRQKNYKHSGNESQRRLQHLQGTWDERGPKKEVTNEINPRDTVYGDAELSADRTDAFLSNERRGLYTNRTHNQGFDGQDVGRSTELYDGLRPRVPYAELARYGVQHTFRHTQRTKEPRMQPESRVAMRVVHGEASTTRREPGDPFAHRQAGHAAREQLRTQDIARRDTHNAARGKASAHRPDLTQGSGGSATCGRRVVGRQPDRPGRAPEREQPMQPSSATDCGEYQVAQREVRVTDRQQVGELRDADLVGDGHLHRPGAGQRRGSDSLARPAATSLTSAPIVDARAAPGLGAQRAGSDSWQAGRAGVGEALETARSAVPLGQGRSVQAELEARAATDEGGMTPQQAVRGTHRAGGTDAIGVRIDHGDGGFCAQAGTRVRSEEDAPVPQRGRVLHRRPNLVGQSAVHASKIRAAERAPRDEVAVVRFGHTGCEVGARKVHGAEDAPLTHRAAQEAPRDSRHVNADATVEAVRHRGEVTQLSCGSLERLPDRLTETYPQQRDQLHRRVSGAVQLDGARGMTPTLELRGGVASDVRPVTPLVLESRRSGAETPAQVGQSEFMLA